jgi:uncharacterized UPF0160 family protein
MLTMATVGTHNGVFHADDVLAVAVLKMVWNLVKVVRTREKAMLDACDCLVDVGGVYDPATNRFDHHQEGRAGARDNGILYSAAGLVWKKFGAIVCNSAAVAELVDRNFIQAVCATDNGQRLFDGGQAQFRNEGHAVHSQSFSSLISSLNPTWDEPQEFDEAFNEAVKLATVFLNREIARSRGMERAKAKTAKALDEREDKRILVMDSAWPWHESTLSDPDVIFTVYPNEVGTWMIKCVPHNGEDRFSKRLPLPAAWAGKRDDELSKLLDLPGVVFCHPGRFIGGHKTKEGALQMARMALHLGPKPCSCGAKVFYGGEVPYDTQVEEIWRCQGACGTVHHRLPK